MPIFEVTLERTLTQITTAKVIALSGREAEKIVLLKAKNGDYGENDWSTTDASYEVA
jgi:hypothetical protein